YDRALVGKPEELLVCVANADALIVRNRTQVTAKVIEHAPLLKVLGRLGVGLDNIDLDACKARKIEVIPATGANALAVAEYVICAAMLLLRRCFLVSAEVARGEWPRGALSEGRELAGKTLGIVGFGSIGQLTAKLARMLGMRVIAYDTAISPSHSAWKNHEVV